MEMKIRRRVPRVGMKLYVKDKGYGLITKVKEIGGVGSVRQRLRLFSIDVRFRDYAPSYMTVTPEEFALSDFMPAPKR